MAVDDGAPHSISVCQIACGKPIYKGYSGKSSIDTDFILRITALQTIDHKEIYCLPFFCKWQITFVFQDMVW